MDEDLLLLGIGAAALILLTKNPISSTISDVGSGVGTAAQGTGSAISEVAQGVSAPFGFVDTIFDTLSKKVKTGSTRTISTAKGQTTQEILNTGSTIYGMTGAQIVANVEATARAKRNSGQSDVVVSAVYDKSSGTGVNTAGYGYSSMSDLGSKGTGTGIKTYVSEKTGTKITRGEGSFLSNVGFN